MMQTTSFPIHEVALSTPEDEDVVSGEEAALGTLIFTWGLRDADMKLVAPIARFKAVGLDPGTMIGFGQQLVEEGHRLKGLETEDPDDGDGSPRDPNPPRPPVPPAQVELITDPQVIRQVAGTVVSA